MMEKLQPKLRFPEFVKDWSNEDIHSILKIGSGRDYKHLNYGNIPVFGTGGLMTYVNDFLYNGETVCIGRKGTIDKPMYYNGPIWTVDTLFYTHSFKNTLPKFIYFCFLNINWKEYNEASGVPSLSKSTIERIIISFPSLPEQQKIASFLTTVDDKISNLKQKVRILVKYKKGVMQQIFSQQIRFKDTAGNDFPEWEEKSLGEVCKIRRGASPRPITDKKWFSEKSDIGWIRISDVSKSTKFLEKTEQYLSEIGVQKSRFVSKGNLIMSICATIGKPIYTNIDVCIPDSFVVFEDLSLNKEYLFYYLDFIQLNWLKYGQPGTQINLNSDIVNNEIIRIPSHEEQTKIAEFLSGIDEKIENTKLQLSKMEVWKKGLLQGMFC